MIKEIHRARELMLERRRDCLAIFLLLSLTLVFMWRVVVLGQVMLPLDMLFTAEPWRTEAIEKIPGPLWNPVVTDAIWLFYPMGDYASESWTQRTPLWDPNVMTGLPGLARGEMFSNPVYSLLSKVFPVAKAMSWAAVLHLLVSALFTFLLLREMGMNQFGSLMGGLVFAFNTYAIGWLSWPIVAGSIAWLPMTFWGVERALRRHDWRWTILGGVGFALQILSGYVLFPFYGAVTLILLAVYRGGIIGLNEKKITTALQPLLYSGLALMLGVALIAPQFLLTLELFTQTPRAEAIGANSFLNPLFHLPRLLVPDISGNPLHGNTYQGQFNFTETDLYFGILALACLIVSARSAQRKLAWGFIGIGLMTLLAVYNLFPFRQFTSIFYPLFLNTFPGRIFYVPSFTWAVATGIGADWIVCARPVRLLRWLGTVGIFIASCLLGIYGAIGFYKSVNVTNAGVDTFLGEIIRWVNAPSLLTSALVLVAGAILLYAWANAHLSRRLFAVLSISFVIVDLFSIGIDYNPTFDPQWIFPETPSLASLQALTAQESQPYRILNVNSNVILPAIVSELYHLPNVAGYSSWLMRRYSDYADLTLQRSPSAAVHVYFGDCCSRLLDALNVRYVYAAPGMIPSSAAGTFLLIANLNRARIETQSLGDVHAPEWWDIGGDKRQVLYEHPSAQISYSLQITKPMRFDSAVGINPDAWDKDGDGVLFEVSVTPQGGEHSESLFSRYMDPKSNPSDRVWLPVQVDLSPYVGKTITLTLTTSPGNTEDFRFDWAGWAEPQIVDYLPATLELVYDGPNKIYRNKAALPRAWIVHRVTPVPIDDLQAVKTRLQAPDFDPAVEAVVEAKSDSRGMSNSSLSSAERVNVKAYAAERVEIEAEAQTAGLLVLSDMMYPGWKVYVDNVAQPIWATNLIMRGVFLEAGKHDIVFVYEPPLLTLGTAITGITLITLAGAWLWTVSRAR